MMYQEKVMRTFRLFLILCVLVATGTILFGCQPMANPVKEAQTVEQQVWATYGVYVVLQEQGAILYKDCSVPASVRQALKVANDSTYPASQELLNLALTVDEIRAEIEAGANEEERYNIAAANLAKYYYTVKPKLEGIRTVVRRAKDERGSVAGAVGVDGCDSGPTGSNRTRSGFGLPGAGNSAIPRFAVNPDSVGAGNARSVRGPGGVSAHDGAGRQSRADEVRVVRVARPLGSGQRGVQSTSAPVA